MKDISPASRPLEEMVPAQILATPSQLTLSPTDQPTWWRPGWQDVKAFVGWRWILLAPAGLVLLLLVGGWYYPAFRVVAVAIGIKVGIVIFAFAASLVGYVTRKALQAGTQPFCIYCGYSLTGLPDCYRCPECGRPYTHALINEYRKDPDWFIERWKQTHQIPPPHVPFESGPSPRRNRAKDGTE